ncbi:exodeoxyribonuclease V subunit beta [Polaromonas sp.]|uniref:UvrD-helicase domain-containing protein n=1 Tax=Polaromonas sp. TaxID=1869339 RepID=UPI002730A9F3|nr:UvrD-helicase domain-containing protein [Polaromonas sp.]MDP2449402.1 UvrD-helicase domain-containing protein [Polaromonas sp.]
MKMVHQAAYEHNGQPVSAEAFYAIACDPRRNVAVEACAGAGKTWMLVSRIVRALLAGAQPHEILAITFTKRAAGEMRERLYEWLEQFAHADDATLMRELAMRGFAYEKGPQPPPEGREQLSNLYQRILATGRAVQIRTFHSWFAALLRSAPLAVLQQQGLPLNYELLEDDAPARALVWRRFYAALLKLPELKADFEAVVLAHGRFQTDKALQAALDKRTEFVLADASGVVDASVQHFTVQFAGFEGLAEPEELLTSDHLHRQTLADAAVALARASAPTFAAKGVELEQALGSCKLQAVFGALLTEKGTPRKFGEKIIGIEQVRTAQDLVGRVLAARQQHEAWLYQQRMARLARLLIAEFTALKRERGWVDMNDIERVALVLLGDEELSGWVQERLDARIRHLLIDEFQDTNPLQWQALWSWLSAYGGAGNAPSVFIVGDPKQSIYRFRRAEPQVFKAAQQFVRQGLDGELLSCDHTRRNAQGVIRTVNAVMGAARENDGYDGFREHTTGSSEEGAVGRLPAIPRSADNSVRAELVEAFDGTSASPSTGSGRTDIGGGWRDSLTTPREIPEETLRTLEARQAAAWISRLLAPTLGTGVSSLPPEGAHFSLGRPGGKTLLPSDIMVLSRKRAGLLPLQDELRALHIPALVGEKTALIDCCEVLDIVALLDVLVSPEHDLSLARALRSPLFGLGDDALVQIALERQALRLPWFKVLQKSEQLPPAIKALVPALLQYQAWLGSLPPHDALQAIYHHGDVLARFAAAAPAAQRAGVLANLRALLSVALQLDGGRYATPYAFVRALKAGGLQAPATVDSAAVRLLTIHGAKGLEADAVLLLDTDTVERNADSMGVLVDWPGADAAPQKFVFLVSESRPPACAADALAAEQEARRREELNALYVALTRARGTLVLSSITPHREAPASWWQRLAAHVGELPAPLPAPVVDPARAGDDTRFILPELPQALVLPAPAAIETVADEDTLVARIGKAMHRLLEWGGVSPARARAVQREFRLDAAQARDAADMAQRILQGEGAWAWDAAVVAWQGNEVELVYQGQTLRLDRLVQRRDAGHAGHWWVLDYKSRGAPQEQPALLEQMQTYRAAVQAVYGGQTVKAAFLTAQGRLVALSDELQ